MRVFISILAALAIVIFAGMFFLRPAIAPGSAPRSTSGKLTVSASIFPLADWLREIGGEDLEVHCLVTGSSNPHHFEPSIKDATRVTQSRALFSVGLGLDPWAENLAKNASTGVKIYEAGKWITPRKMGSIRTIEVGKGDDDHHHHDHGGMDPHFWLDPARAITVVTEMAKVLGELDPQHRDAFTKRADAYIEKLKSLNAEIDQAAKSFPPKTQIATFHDAYGYLLERLNIRLAAVVQTSPGVEPGTKEITDAVRLMKLIGQKVVFQEPSSNASAIKVIAAELDAKIELLDPMDTESSEAGKTYVDRMRHNISVLVKAIGASK